MTGDKSFSIFAPAKINLTLHVTGRRADGYHLLDSLVVFADVGDEVRVSPADRLSLTIDGPFAEGLTSGEDNLIVRAARRLAEAVGFPPGGGPGADIVLTKRLPVASGIGGGSADAAAALKGLCRLWGVAPSEADLRAVALGLGADVPVCLLGRPVNMSGVGEVLDPAPPLPEAWLVLVNPGVHVSTPAIFKARRDGFSAAAPLLAAPRDLAALVAELKARRNDLTEPAARLAPAIGGALAALDAAPRCLLARMSGSGATCFGLFAEEAEAAAAARRIAADHPGWWVAPTRLLG